MKDESEVFGAEEILFKRRLKTNLGKISPTVNQRREIFDEEHPAWYKVC